ncbi:hypothetical protein DV735_g3200, partial [Chaetothyriales sp. CBS 134920]
MGFLSTVSVSLEQVAQVQPTWQLALLALPSALALLIVAHVIRQLVFFDRKAPPEVFSLVPGIGSTIHYGIDPFNFFFTNYEKYGDVFTFILLGRKVTVCLDTKGNDFVLNGKLKDFNAEEVYTALTTPVFGKDVVYDCPNSKLMEQKKFVKFGLTTEAFKSYVDLISAEVVDFVKSSPKLANQTGKFDVTKVMAELTIYTASRSLQGKEVRERFDSTFADMYHDLDLGFAPINFMLPWAPLPHNRARDRAQKKMAETYMDIIRERRAAGGKREEGEEDMIWNLMSCVYKDGKPPPDREIAHIMIALLMAGQHSSSSTSSWIILRLASRPDIQEELLAEQKKVLGDDLPPLTYESLQKLTLNAKVVKETLRLHAPIHSILRQVKSSMVVVANTPSSTKEYVIPPSHRVLSAPGFTARQEKYFPEPMLWEPHRWDEGHPLAYTGYGLEKEEFEDYGYGMVSKGASSPYLPFGAGRHRCIGEQFAYVQLGTVIAMLVRLIKVEAIPGKPLVGTDYSSLFSRPLAPADVTFTRRNLMGFLDKSPVDATSGNNANSEVSTTVPSTSASTTDLDKERASAPGSPTKNGSDQDASGSEQQDEKTGLETEDGDGNDEALYPSGLKLGLIMIALCLSIFLVALDNTIIATAIPRITDQFKSLGDVGWYASAYLLTTCSLQLFFGKMYTFYSIKLVYICSIAIFEIGSAICGAAPNSTALIVGRAIAGVGSAGIFSGGLVIIAYSVPMAKRPMYTGLVGAMYGIASIAGPLLGGVFTDKVSWRWCFYINLPFAVPTLLFIFVFFRSPTRKAEAKVPFAQRAIQLDLPGTAVFIVDIVCCLLALQWGGSTYAWSNWRVVLCLTLFGVLTTVFIFIQWKMGDNATVPFRIISQRSVAAASWFAFTLGAGFFTLVYWVPIWFQAIKEASAFKSGIMCLPMVLALVIANILSGIGTTATGYYTPFYYISVVLSAVGAGLITTWTTHTAHPEWIGYQVIYGLGVGFGMQQALITIQAVLPLRDVPTGTAIAMFTQNFGGALFVSVAQNVFNNRLVSELVEDAKGLDPSIILHVGATSLADAIPAEFLPGVREAYNTALTETFYISVAMVCLSAIGAAFVEWKSVKGMKPGVVAG